MTHRQFWGGLCIVKEGERISRLHVTVYSCIDSKCIDLFHFQSSSSPSIKETHKHFVLTPLFYIFRYLHMSDKHGRVWFGCCCVAFFFLNIFSHFIPKNRLIAQSRKKFVSSLYADDGWISPQNKSHIFLLHFLRSFVYIRKYLLDESLVKKNF